MWYEDLTECENYADLLPGNHIAVGWLEKGKSYNKGNTNNLVIDKLYELYEHPEPPEIRHRFCGFHECDFCNEINKEMVELGATTLWVVYNGIIYNCPALILNYIKEHNYRPPDEFIEAVLNYNHQYAEEFLRKLAEEKYPYLRKNK